MYVDIQIDYLVEDFNFVLAISAILWMHFEGFSVLEI